MSVWMPGASRAQDFSDRYPGTAMRPRIGLIHTTEGTSWPSYDQGKSAPHFTVRRGEIRQHFRVDRSARALQNKPGGVETNTAGPVQVEIIGTCDARFAERYPAALYVPEATADDLEAFLALVAWLEQEHGIPRVDAAPRGWLNYGPDSGAPGRLPASYGASPVRLTPREWSAARGWLGHQHVPENTHGDPGRFPMHLITTGSAAAPESEEDDMYPSNKMVFKTENGVETNLVHNPGSGWFHEFQIGTDAAGASYINAIAALYETGNRVGVTPSHYAVIKDGLERLGEVQVTVAPAQVDPAQVPA